MLLFDKEKQVRRVYKYKYKHKNKVKASEVSEENSFLLDNKGSYILYIKSSLRGMHINVSNNHGTVIKNFNAGKLGFRKALRYKQASLRALSQEILSVLKSLDPKLTNLNIVLKGFGFKRNKIIKFLMKASTIRPSIVSIIDLSDVPYNGCRPKKLRRK